MKRQREEWVLLTPIEDGTLAGARWWVLEAAVRCRRVVQIRRSPDGKGLAAYARVPIPNAVEKAVDEAKCATNVQPITKNTKRAMS